MSHLASTRGALEAECRAQVRAFDQFLEKARKITPNLGWIHLANSAGISTGLGSRYDTVRPGLAAYGAMPEDLPGSEQLRPVMGLHSQVVFIKDLPQGSPVGYGSTWRAERATRIATLPIGYADGLPWGPTGRGEVLLAGQRAPIIGRISMDYTTVDVGHIRDLSVGTKATLVGRDGEHEIRLGDLAAWTDTIPYEVSCNLGRRVQRLYSGGEQVILPSQEAPIKSPAKAPEVVPAKADSGELPSSNEPPPAPAYSPSCAVHAGAPTMKSKSSDPARSDPAHKGSASPRVRWMALGALGGWLMILIFVGVAFLESTDMLAKFLTRKAKVALAPLGLEAQFDGAQLGWLSRSVSLRGVHVEATDAACKPRSIRSAWFGTFPFPEVCNCPKWLCAEANWSPRKLACAG